MTVPALPTPTANSFPTVVHFKEQKWDHFEQEVQADGEILSMRKIEVKFDAFVHPTTLHKHTIIARTLAKVVTDTIRRNNLSPIGKTKVTLYCYVVNVNQTLSLFRFLDFTRPLHHRYQTRSIASFHAVTYQTILRNILHLGEAANPLAHSFIRIKHYAQ